MKHIHTYEEAVAYINSTPRFTSKHSMEETKAFLARLGNPDRKLKIVHVAGTNGKGSVCAYLCSILRTTGKKVGLFTSPHLVDIRERFMIDGEMISKECFLSAFSRIYELSDPDGYHPTFFEFLFFMGMLIFEEEAPDVVILETGLGGRLDATNSVGHKELSVITRISLDHVQYLGDTVAKIAAEKAGIMMKNVPVVYGDNVPEASEVFREQAKTLNCPAFSVGEDQYFLRNIKNKSIDFSITNQYYESMCLTIPTIALYQMENASIAVTAACVLLKQEDPEKVLPAETVQNALQECFWQGRMEEILPDVFVDGAHNEDGIRAFLDTVKADGYDGKRYLLFSVVADKDYPAMIRQIAGDGLFQEIAVSHLSSDRAATVDAISAYLREDSYTNFQVIEQPGEALDYLRKKKKAGERIYIAGSLYLVGEIKSFVRTLTEYD